MRFGWLKARQTKYTGYVTLYTLVVLAVLGAANYLADQHNASYDSTKNKLYSLSDQTLKVVKGLKEDVSITYFDRSTGFGHARDLFDRYANLSRRLKVVYVDLEQNPQLARTMGVRNLGTIFVQAGAKREEAKSLTEEEVTGALIRSLKSGDRNACFVTGSGEHSIEETDRGGYAAAKQAVERNNYKTKAISLLRPTAAEPAPAGAPAGAAAPAPGKIEVPKDCTVLIVAGPQHDYVQPEADAIKSYVEEGGH